MLVSLLLLTVYFRESSNGGLHGAQSAGAGVLRPFELAAERVARPFRDAAGWFGDVLGAKSENEKLRKQVDKYRQQAIENQVALRENAELRRLLAFKDSPRFPVDYRGVATRVISRTNQFEQQVGIAAGSSSGIRPLDPVVTADGLVGRVTKVGDDVAQVTLLTDETSAVSALDFQTQADGIVQHHVGSPETLALDRVTKDQVVNPGDVIVTAGSRVSRFASIYPRGIPIGTVTSEGQNDTDLYKQVLVQPFVHFSSLETVLVLVPNKRQRLIP